MLWRGSNHVGVCTDSGDVRGKQRWDTNQHEDDGGGSRKRPNTMVRPLLDNGKGKTPVSQNNTLELHCHKHRAVENNGHPMAMRTEGNTRGGSSHSTTSAGAPTNDESCNDNSSGTGVEQVNTHLSDHRVEEPVPRRPHSHKR
jgi:hypothetical protein